MIEKKEPPKAEESLSRISWNLKETSTELKRLNEILEKILQTLENNTDSKF